MIGERTSEPRNTSFPGKQLLSRVEKRNMMTHSGAITLATANIPMIKPEKAGRRRTGTH
jgi:hypothetical protein